MCFLIDFRFEFLSVSSVSSVSSVYSVVSVFVSVRVVSVFRGYFFVRNAPRTKAKPRNTLITLRSTKQDAEKNSFSSLRLCVSAVMFL